MVNPQEALAKLKLTMTAQFIPFSKSRNASQKSPSLNWKVKLFRDGREFVETDYMAGCGHCPAYKNARGSKTSIYNDARIRTECEKGFPVRSDSEHTVNMREPLLPKIEDVLY